MTEWYERWFGEEYLQLYPHRNDADARAAVSLVAAHAPVPGRRILDLACGPGRHARQLAGAGGTVMGLDLSMPLLRRARELRLASTSWVRGDVRVLPFRAGAFALVVNLFTSFGYFADDRDHADVLAEVARVLAPGGTFVLDYFHAGSVRRGLVGAEEQMLGTQRVLVQRRISPDGRFVLKDMHLTADGRHFEERVRLFAPAELERLITGAGMVVEQTFGAYDGAPLTDQAPRAIFFARRP